MSKFIISCAIFCMTLNTYAQVEMKMGKVSEEELTKEKSLIDENAGAEVLGEFGDLHFRFESTKGLSYYFTYHKRIKIYDKSGYDYADISIPVYANNGASGETISSIKAYTYNLVDGKVERTKLANSDIIDEEVTKQLTKKKLSFPQVKEGSVIEYKYTMVSNWLRDVPDWTFQEDIPVVWSEYNFRIPEWFKFRPMGQGFVPYEIYETKSEAGSDPAISRSLTWAVNSTTWAVKDVAPLEDERYISSKENYISKITFQMLSYQFPGETYHNIARNYPSFNKGLLESGNFGEVLNKRGFLEDEARSVAGSGSDTEKALALYTHVRNEMAWNEFYGKYPSDVKKAWKEKTGSVGDINFILVMMMKNAGLNAEPVILSTRSNGYPHPVYPESDKFNYVITGVNLDGNWFLLDATAKGYPFGTLPIKCLNGQGWIVSENQAGWVPLKGISKNRTLAQAKMNLHKNGVLDGDLTITSLGYHDISRRISLYQKGEEDYVQDLDDDLIEWSIDSASFENQDNAYTSLVTKFHLSNTDNEDSDIIYLNPLIINQYTENPFEADSRVMPIDFPYGSSQQFVMEIKLPDGYTVEELPEATVFQLPGGAATYQFSATTLGNKISIVNNLKITKTLYNSEEYEVIKKFFELMVTKQGEQIVIKKTT